MRKTKNFKNDFSDLKAEISESGWINLYQNGCPLKAEISKNGWIILYQNGCSIVLGNARNATTDIVERAIEYSKRKNKKYRIIDERDEFVEVRR